MILYFTLKGLQNFKLYYKYVLKPLIQKNLSNKRKNQNNQNIEDDNEDQMIENFKKAKNNNNSNASNNQQENQNSIISPQDLLFQLACKAIKKCKDTPPELQLELYGLYKQQKEGNNNITDTSNLDYIAKQKHQAWENCVGMTQDEARQEYITIVGQIIPEFQQKIIQIAEEPEQFLEANGQIYEDDEENQPGTTWGLAPSKMTNQYEYHNENLDNIEVLKEDEQILFDFIKEGDLKSLQKYNLTEETFKLQNEQGVSILHSAIDNEQQEIAEYLIAKIELLKINPDIIDVEGQTPLHYAVLMENDDLMMKLVYLKANPEYQDLSGETPLDIASKEQQQKIKGAL